MILKSLPRNREQYNTCDDFKRDLELIMWCHLDNDFWLQVKPKKALPWHRSDMETAILRVFKLLTQGQN